MSKLHRISAILSMPGALTSALTLLHLQGVRDAFVLVLVRLEVLSKAQLLKPLQPLKPSRAGKQVPA